jgi:hypothetical protein
VLQRRSRSRRRRKPPARSDSRGSLRSARSTRKRLRCLSRRGSPSALAPFSPTPATATAQLPPPHSYRDRRPPPLPPQHSDRYNTATRRARWSRTDCDSRTASAPADRTATASAPHSHRRFLVPRGRSLRSLSQDRVHARCASPHDPHALRTTTTRRTRAEGVPGTRRRRAHGQEHRPIRAGARAAGREPSSASLPGFQAASRTEAGGAGSGTVR